MIRVRDLRLRFPGVMRGVVEGGGARGSSVMTCPNRLWHVGGARRGGIGRCGRRGRSGRRRGGSGAPPPLHSRQSSAWWDDVSNIVTRLAREIVT